MIWNNEFAVNKDNSSVNLIQRLHQSVQSSSLFAFNEHLLSPLVKVHLDRSVKSIFLIFNLKKKNLNFF